MAQGYYFSPPISAEKLKRIFQGGRPTGPIFVRVYMKPSEAPPQTAQKNTSAPLRWDRYVLCHHVAEARGSCGAF